MALLATLAFVAGAACAGGRPEEPADGADDASLRGVVAAVEPGPDGTRVILDDAAGAAEPGRAVLLVSPGTPVEVERADGTVARGAMADVAVGARLRAWHSGAVMRSLPPQYTATRLRVVRGG